MGPPRLNRRGIKPPLLTTPNGLKLQNFNRLAATEGGGDRHASLAVTEWEGDSSLAVTGWEGRFLALLEMTSTRETPHCVRGDEKETLEVTEGGWSFRGT